MREITPEADWPESWAYSYKYDREEVFGTPSNWGYAYAYRNRRKETLLLVTEAVNPGATILDLAAAQGNFTLDLAERGYRVTWNDLRADLAGYVQRKYEWGDVRYIAGNAFELTFAEGFDCVLFCEVVEHVAHPDQFIANIARLVKPGGVAVMTTPNGRCFRNGLPRFSDFPDPSVFETEQFKPDSDGHIFLLWPDEIRNFAQQSGLSVERQTFFTTPLTNGYMKMHYLLPFMPEPWVWALERVAQLLPPNAKELLMVQTATRFRKTA
jgi:2-polyprenyl-6-hydroxyphenyl methylase/3-demethylubiquinone-9 3-methyltransferase